MIVSLTVNGEPRTAEVAGFESLLWLLRERLGLRGAKDACLQGECGACSVLLDGELVCACLVLAADAEGLEVTTVEGLGDAAAPHRVQQAFVEHGAVQCGYCTPGLVVAVAHLLETRPEATTDDVREALAGNLCRCTGYGAIVRATTALLADAAPGEGGDRRPADGRAP
jgi:aerobic carbon-monoxide dehydrogenase small subunit